ncbi:hypothetical protein IWQ60_003219 [Tieghemiomyces parasiticus]|uniref:Uncharacterized protein n=1 Tax=Tieghemiomyces parasiticus TaxID=78921 RepID=A0A9W8AFZ0_9FUNG|nr:hypothetical protein IWQ60_003219 [Tieghemiomyces parasiticus]
MFGLTRNLPAALLARSSGTTLLARSFSISPLAARSALHLNFPPSVSSTPSHHRDVSSGRSIAVLTANPMAPYSRLNGILSGNNIRRELRLKRRYEKPNKKRVRLSIERSNKRFNAMVREKMELVDKMRRM